ncbi:BrnA antitoxin family protein [Verminephrobacter sp. Larva24]|nr:BrnA antitoxin family protein [Verminephrobacter sp. Larva24]
MNAKSENTPAASPAPDGAPELGDEFFERADEYLGDKPVHRGRPRLARPQQLLTILFDADVIEAFKATGSGWQTRMNDALKDWVAAHRA